jgi:hypothetical protein
MSDGTELSRVREWARWSIIHISEATNRTHIARGVPTNHICFVSDKSEKPYGMPLMCALWGHYERAQLAVEHDVIWQLLKSHAVHCYLSSKSHIIILSLGYCFGSLRIPWGFRVVMLVIPLCWLPAMPHEKFRLLWEPWVWGRAFLIVEKRRCISHTSYLAYSVLYSHLLVCM